MRIGYYILSIFYLIPIHKILAQASFAEVSLSAGINASAGDAAFGLGISFVDFDLDGFDDLTFATDYGDSILFYKNLGNGNFLKLPSLVNDTQLVRSILWVDIENDGDLDLFITSHPSDQTLLGGQNKLYKNLGNMVLQEVTNTCGLLIRNDNSFGAAFADYDNDGDLDLFVSNRTDLPNTFYKNLGNGNFQDITSIVGISTASGTADMCSAFFDIENDNVLELITIVDKYNEPNKLYKKNSPSTYTEVSSTYWDVAFDQLDAMNAGIGDFNNDGYQDIYITNTEGGNKLLRHNAQLPPDIYYNVLEAGIQVNQTSWGASWLDADNDKDLDLYVSVERGNNIGWASKFFKNNGDESFTAAEIFPGDTLNSFSNAFADYNLDGKIDIAVSSSNNDPLRLWKNQISNANHHIKFKLVGVQSNKFAIGARVVLYSGGNSGDTTKQTRMMHCGINYMAQPSNTIHFGTKNDLVIDSLIVYWPAGGISKFYNLGVDQTYTITEGSCLTNEHINKYIGTDGNLNSPSNWSKGRVPLQCDNVLIENTNTAPIILTNNSTLNIKSLDLKGNIVFNNNGTINLKHSLTFSIKVGTGAHLYNSPTGTIHVEKCCADAVVVQGSINQKGLLKTFKN